MRGGVVFCEEAGFVVGGEDEESEDGVEGEGGHGYYVKIESEGGGEVGELMSGGLILAGCRVLAASRSFD